MTTSSSNKNIKTAVKSATSVWKKFSFTGNSKTKTIFCRSVVGKGECGAFHGNPCIFAHSIAEIKPNACRFGRTCKFYNGGDQGKTCAFIHPGETFDNYVSRQGFPNGNRKRTSASSSIHLNSIAKGEFAIPKKVTVLKVESNDDWPALSTVSAPPSINSWGPSKKDIEYDSIYKDPTYTKTLAIDRTVLEKMTSDKNIENDTDLSLYYLNKTCVIERMSRNIKNIENWTNAYSGFSKDKGVASKVKFEVDKIDFTQKGDKVKPRRLSSDEKKLLPESYIMRWQDSFNKRII